MNSLKYYVDGSKLILELDVKPKGKVQIKQVSDLVVHHIDEKGRLIKAEITGLWRLPKMEENVTIAEWEGKVKRGRK
ncbi:MAG: hypothetical protein IIA58_01560 [Candidatus Marinimicrobia bacterium]|nr:hypothetical protein [Candidatus Neomarinimicrobiota bacterium]